MSYLVFKTQATFDSWHAKAKVALGLPWIGNNARYGYPMPNVTQVTDYAEPVEHPGVANNTVCCRVDTDQPETDVTITEVAAGATKVQMQTELGQGKNLKVTKEQVRLLGWPASKNGQQGEEQI